MSPFKIQVMEALFALAMRVRLKLNNPPSIQSIFQIQYLIGFGHRLQVKVSIVTRGMFQQALEKVMVQTENMAVIVCDLCATKNNIDFI
jgi:hypothetical protein